MDIREGKIILDLDDAHMAASCLPETAVQKELLPQIYAFVVSEKDIIINALRGVKSPDFSRKEVRYYHGLALILGKDSHNYGLESILAAAGFCCEERLHDGTSTEVFSISREHASQLIDFYVSQAESALHHAVNPRTGAVSQDVEYQIAAAREYRSKADLLVPLIPETEWNTFLGDPMNSFK